MALTTKVKAQWVNPEKTADMLEGGVWEVGCDALHAAYVEFGTMPHMPPVAPILKWVNRKLGVRGKEGERTAWAIAKTIEKCGTAANPYLRPAIDEAMGRNFTSAEEMAEFIFNRLQDNIIEKGISDDGTLLKSAYYKEVD